MKISNQEKEIISVISMGLGLTLNAVAMFKNELSVIHTSNTAIGRIKSTCGWQKVHLLALDLDTTYDVFYANHQAEIAGYLWFTLCCAAMIIALCGMIIRWKSDIHHFVHDLWSKLNVLAGFLLILAAICSLYGGSDNVCHQSNSQIGISQYLTLFAAVFYIGAEYILSSANTRKGYILIEPED